MARIACTKSPLERVLLLFGTSFGVGQGKLSLSFNGFIIF
jgi:hypothetical protein